MKNFWPEHTVLPAVAQAKLMMAAATDPETPRSESYARSRSIDRAIRVAKIHYPSFFKPEASPTKE